MRICSASTTVTPSTTSRTPLRSVTLQRRPQRRPNVEELYKTPPTSIATYLLEGNGNTFYVLLCIRTFLWQIFAYSTVLFDVSPLSFSLARFHNLTRIALGQVFHEVLAWAAAFRNVCASAKSGATCLVNAANQLYINSLNIHAIGSTRQCLPMDAYFSIQEKGDDNERAKRARVASLAEQR